MTNGGVDIAMSVVPEAEPQDVSMQHPMDALREMSISARSGTLAGGNNDMNNNSMLPPAPVRRVERNKSGGQGSRLVRGRVPPKRTQSHKIGRPTFDPTAPAEPVRGVNRSHSNRVKAAPGRSGSFHRKVPNRSSSTSSLRASRRQQQQQQQQQQHGIGTDTLPDDISVSDSVFTSASNQTLDSIMLRKKQIDHGPDGQVIPGVSGATLRGQRAANRTSNGSIVSEIEFDESLHTVDSMHLHHNRHHVTNDEEYYDEQCDMSIFSESFHSDESDCEVLSDYDDEDDEEALMDGPIKEDEETTVKSAACGVDESME